MNKHLSAIAVIGALVGFNCNAEVLVPHTFSEGTPAKASEVNQNFTALKEGIDTNLSIQESQYVRSQDHYSWYNYHDGASNTSEVAVASCPVGTVVTGGSVECSGEDTNHAFTNFGLVTSSAPAGNSWIGACYADALTHSSTKYGPGITVHAMCTSIGTSANKLASKSTKGTSSKVSTATPDAKAMAMYNKLNTLSTSIAIPVKQ